MNQEARIAALQNDTQHVIQSLEMLAQTDWLERSGLMNLSESIASLKGNLIVAGVGKTGLIGQLLVAGMRAIGVSAYFVHATEAAHGDLGTLTPDDIVLILSKSGQSSECFPLIDYVCWLQCQLVAITMNESSYLVAHANHCIILPLIKEFEPVGLLPTASNLMFVWLSEVLKQNVIRIKDFTEADFVQKHPGGSIGIKGMRVDQLMRRGDDLPLVSAGTKLPEVIGVITSKKAGCALVISEKTGKLEGIITDGDIRRNINREMFEKEAASIMTRDPKYTTCDQTLEIAEIVMTENNISDLPVCDENACLEGILTMNDIVFQQNINLKSQRKN